MRALASTPLYRRGLAHRGRPCGRAGVSPLPRVALTGRRAPEAHRRGRRLVDLGRRQPAAPLAALDRRRRAPHARDRGAAAPVVDVAPGPGDAALRWRARRPRQPRRARLRWPGRILLADVRRGAVAGAGGRGRAHGASAPAQPAVPGDQPVPGGQPAGHRHRDPAGPGAARRLRRIQPERAHRLRSVQCRGHGAPVDAATLAPAGRALDRRGHLAGVRRLAGRREPAARDRRPGGGHRHSCWAAGC